TDIDALKIEVPEDQEEINRIYYERGWNDGLPIIPPTEERVSRMLEATKRNADEILGIFPPRGNEAMVGHIAINAVMAGCLPEHMPVLITVVEAVLEEQFNLNWIQATTHPVAPLVIINGPIRERLSFNCGSNLFGPGNRTNAVIGRAVRLILLNIGGAKPGELDLSTQGQPSKYSFCIAENEEMNPWEPLHVERGFDRSSSTVTVCGVENPHNINDHTAEDANDLLTTIVGTITTQGNNNIIYKMGETLLLIGPEHASIIAESGFSKQGIKQFLYENARIPKTLFSGKHQEEQFTDIPDVESITLAQGPDEFMIVVAGGAGKHSSYCPSFAFTRSLTKEISE
ncbi:hypothetical protein ACFL7M_13905, partial [Thermodesulfobacteriota bacterium]